VLGSFLAIGITGYLVEDCAWSGSNRPASGAMFAGGPADRARFLRPEQRGGALDAPVALVGSLAAVFGFIASLPYTRLLHTLAGPLNLFFARPELGRMTPITMEEVEKTERVGVSAINHFQPATNS